MKKINKTDIILGFNQNNDIILNTIAAKIKHKLCQLKRPEIITTDQIKAIIQNQMKIEKKICSNKGTQTEKLLKKFEEKWKDFV